MQKRVKYKILKILAAAGAEDCHSRSEADMSICDGRSDVPIVSNDSRFALVGSNR